MQIAIIDMGTNTFNLLVVELLKNNQYEILLRDKAGVKLGKGGINDKRITPEAFERGILAIEKHLTTIKNYKVDKIVTTATSGVRSTANGNELVKTIEDKFGLHIQVISGDEEAELIFRGVKQAVKFNKSNVLILDIGGGSNEFIIANQSGLIWKQSFKLGMARLLDMFNPADPISFEEIKKVENYIDTNLADLYNAMEKYKPNKLIGCSGTFDSFRGMILAKNGGIPEEVKKKNSYPINIKDYEELHIDLIKSTLEDRKKMEGLELVRVEMIVLASIFVNFIIRKFKINSLYQSAFAIKEGMVDKIFKRLNINSMAKILVIDDEKSIRDTLKEILEYEDHKVDLAADGEEGLEQFKNNKYDIVLLDIKMPKKDGIEVLEDIFGVATDVPVIMISGHGNIDTAVESIKKGAYDFIEKPLDLNRLLVTIRNAMDRTSLITETKTLKRQVTKTFDIVGESEPIVKVKNMIEKVASTDARVLITGPNGSGKELVARWLHEKSERAEFPFVEVNCAAIPSELIESELFGHEKGAFTSAHKQRKGKFEQAHTGTIFLDEIGDMSLNAQAKVLKALEEKKVSRVGSDKDIHVDVRIIAATNKNLKDEIENNNFREDLYHRLSVILISVPGLNERKDDIPLLVDHFNTLICSDYGVPKLEIKDDAIEELKKINWTGNIREFRNVLERLIILCEKEIKGKDVVAYAQPISK